MNAILKNEISDVFNKINNLIQETEHIYGSVYQQLPSIEEELELNVQEMDILLNYFIYQSEEGFEDPTEDIQEATQLAELLREMKKKFTYAVVKMFDEEVIKKTLERFLANTGNPDEPGIDDLMDIIQKIKKHIQDIEVVSINAMIHSSRLGNDGKAFGVISRNIKEFSKDMKDQYGRIFTYAEGLNHWNNQFTDKINKLLDFSSQLRIQRLDEFSVLFYEVFGSLRTISVLLKEANYNLHSAIHPLRDLMVLIQKQDIIKQSLENVIKCLEGIEEVVYIQEQNDESEEVTKLNIITFQDKVVDMGIALIDSISQQLNESLAEIEETVNIIHNNLSATYEESTAVAEFLSGDRTNERNTVEEIFYKVNSFISHFRSELQNVGEDMQEFSRSSVTFGEQMEGIEKQIITIKDRVEFLRNVNVLSRIELSRLTQDMASFGNEIEQISMRVMEEVNLNESFIIALRETLDGDLERFFEMLEQNDGMIKKMIETSNQSLENLAMIEELVLKAIKPTGEASERLVNEMKKVADTVSSSNVLIDKMFSIREHLVKVQEQIQEDKDRIFAEAGIEHWENQSDEMLQLYERLTTYYERVVASEYMDDDMDVGSEAGELTFF